MAPILYEHDCFCIDNLAARDHVRSVHQGCLDHFDIFPSSLIPPPLETLCAGEYEQVKKITFSVIEAGLT